MSEQNQNQQYDQIDQLIITSPYQEPVEHWKQNPETRLFFKQPGRRPAGYKVATDPKKKIQNDPGRFIELKQVNRLRPKVRDWANEGWPGASPVTRRLLEHWTDPKARQYPFFFCQMEAVETLIWLIEVAQGESLPERDGDLQRICSKLATGAGKTIVMAMLIVWQSLNSLRLQQKAKRAKLEYAHNFLIVAPGLTVKQRLQVLVPDSWENYYEAFQVIPQEYKESFRKAKVKVINWHQLNWDSEEQIAKRKSVDKRGPKSDRAYLKEVLEGLEENQSLAVINDEAHHAWRMPENAKEKDFDKEVNDPEEATLWISALDRIQSAKGISGVFDFSATPYIPGTKSALEDLMFPWIVSDFGLNDAIEAGLVKTPRFVVRDDGKLSKEQRSRFYHIYKDEEVKNDLNRKDAKESDPLPQLVVSAYHHLGRDWEATFESWQEQPHIPVPPVMITVANRTETSARIEYAFKKGRIDISPLTEEKFTLRIDSKILGEAESTATPAITFADYMCTDGPEPAKNAKERAEFLRMQVDSVGQQGRPGEQVRHVISVGMLTEGWDANTVTHIMGLRAFTSQLLCEQVVGRGLRRRSYAFDEKTKMLSAEYVNVFGIPFDFLPHEGEGEPPPPRPESTKVFPVIEKMQYELDWPNVTRIHRHYRQKLIVEWDKVAPLTIDTTDDATKAELGPLLDGSADESRLDAIDLEKYEEKYRLQKTLFTAAIGVYDEMETTWQGDKANLLSQLIGLTEEFMGSQRIIIKPANMAKTDPRRRILLSLHASRMVNHIKSAIHAQNVEELELELDKDKPIRSTQDMPIWFTPKETLGQPQKCHINVCVLDSNWEGSAAFELDRNKRVRRWVKNDQLGFHIWYHFNGAYRRYRPDYLLELTNDRKFVLEIKGKDKDKPETQAKRAALQEWVRAVNAHGGFGQWGELFVDNPKVLADRLEEVGE